MNSFLSPFTLPLVTERWEFTANGEVQGTPTVDGTNVYVADEGGTVSQLDAATGIPVWQTSLPSISGNSASYSRNSPAIGTSAVIVGDQSSSNLYALSKTNGSLVWQTALDSNPDAFIRRLSGSHNSSGTTVGNSVSTSAGATVAYTYSFCSKE